MSMQRSENERDGEQVEQRERREPYERPTVERFAPVTNVAFQTVAPATAVAAFGE
jgi:hypothetical protein